MPIGKDLQALSDQEIVALAREGRESAYRELVRRYERPVFSLVFRMVRDRALAEDLSQDAFVKVLNALDSYRPEYRFSSWIFKIANNVTIDHLRKRELPTLSLDGAPDARTQDEVDRTAFQATDGSESALDELQARELGGFISEAISKLRPEYRSCILLRHVEGRAYEEIAEALDLPLGTVKTYIHRARHELRGYLEHTREE
jgi:RNA polymerase sigma-70 factor (ECF subfamily)